MEQGRRKYDLNDFRDHLRKIIGMGSIRLIKKWIPGIPDGCDSNKELVSRLAILDSMTNAERLNPEILDFSRRRRIASGAGVTLRDVQVLIKQVEDLSNLMNQFPKMSIWDRVKKLIGLVFNVRH